MAISEFRKTALIAAALVGLLTFGATAQRMEPTPDRRAGEGDGPYDRLIIRGATVIDGTGAPPRGPIDIVIAQDRIQEISSVGYPLVPLTTVLLYVLACDPLPPCPARLKVWLRSFLPSRLPERETTMPTRRAG